MDATDTFNTPALQNRSGYRTRYPRLSYFGCARHYAKKSSNVGTSKLSAMFTPKEMYDFYHDLGVGVRMHSGFPGETAGLLRSWRRWQKIEQATMSFGYGLQLSLLQLARAYTVLTHDGELLPVSFEKQAVAPKGKRVIKPLLRKKVRELMVSVTEAGGTGTAGAVDSFDVGAKPVRRVNWSMAAMWTTNTSVRLSALLRLKSTRDRGRYHRRTYCQRLLRRRGCRSRIQRSHERKLEHLGRFPDQAFK